MSERDAVMWGVHNDEPAVDFVASSFVGLDSQLDTDLTRVAASRETMKAALAAKRPDASAPRIAAWAGIAFRFVATMETGDLVVHPSKADRTVAIGRVSSGYEFAQGESKPHRRRVTWLRTEIPRTEFSQDALYEIGSFMTVFQVRRNFAEFLRAVGVNVDTVEAPPVEPDLEDSELASIDDPNAARIEEATRDFAIRTLHEQLEGVEFEHLVADVLQAMGYETEVTQASGDGGVDVLAYRDRLGLEPPIIKVQCKRTTTSIGAPIVQSLVGTLAAGGIERALFVTLGGFSKDAQRIAQHRHDLRLIDGPTLVDLIIEHYDALSARYRRLLPMRPVYVVDQDLAIG